MVDVRGGVVADPGVAVRGIVGGEEGLALGEGVLPGVEDLGEAQRHSSRPIVNGDLPIRRAISRTCRARLPGLYLLSRLTGA